MSTKTAWTRRAPYSKKHYPDGDWWWLKIKTTSDGYRVVLCARCLARNVLPPEYEVPGHCGLCGYAPRKIVRYVREWKRSSHRGRMGRPLQECDILLPYLFDERGRNIDDDPLIEEHFYEQTW